MGGTATLDANPIGIAGTAGHDAQQFRRMVLHGRGEGVIATTDAAVSQRAAGANMSVDVAACTGLVVKGETVSNQGKYFASWTAAKNCTLTAADGSNPRIDRIIAEIKDDDHDSSGQTEVQVRAVDGTPTAAATLTNLNGAASVPTGCVLLANVLVASGDTSITDAEIDTNIGNIRAFSLPDIVVPYCRMYANAAYSMANGYDFVQFDTEHYDTLGNLGTINSDNPITLRVPGRWLVSGLIQWAANATGYRMAQIMTDQTTVWASSQLPTASAAAQTDQLVSAVVVSTGATVANLRGYQSSGGGLNAEAGLSDTFLEATWLGPAA
jgi:hypothetical protein